jgi:hypothetical protein
MLPIVFFLKKTSWREFLLNQPLPSVYTALLFPVFWAFLLYTSEALTVYIFLGQSFPITISLGSLELRRNILSQDQKKGRTYRNKRKRSCIKTYFLNISRASCGFNRNFQQKNNIGTLPGKKEQLLAQPKSSCSSTSCKIGSK